MTGVVYSIYNRVTTVKFIHYILLAIISLPLTVFCQIDPSRKPTFNPKRVPFTMDITCEGSTINLDDTLKKYTTIEILRLKNVKYIVSTSSSVFENSHVNRIHFYGCSKESISKVLTAFSIKKYIQEIWIKGISWGALPEELALFDKIYILIVGSSGRLNLGGLTRLKAIGVLSIHDSTEIDEFPKYYNPRFRMDSLDMLVDSANGLPRNTEKIPGLKHIGLGSFNVKSSAFTKAIAEAARCPHLQALSIFSELRDLPENIGMLRVKALSFTMNKLKYLPSSIASIRTLERIELAGNEFETFPEILLTMPSLKYIDISSNSIRTFSDVGLPVKLLRESNVELLYVAYNQLASFPLEVLKMPKLRYVDISHNKFSHIPDTIRNAARFEIRID